MGPSFLALQSCVPPKPLSSPSPGERHFLTLLQRALASSLLTLTQPSSRHPFWESVDPPENPSYPQPDSALLCLENTHSLVSLKILSLHQGSAFPPNGISPRNTFRLTYRQANNVSTQQTNVLVLFVCFKVWKQYSREFNCWNPIVLPPGLAFQLWHLNAVGHKVRYLSFQKLYFPLCSMGIILPASQHCCGPFMKWHTENTWHMLQLFFSLFVEHLVTCLFYINIKHYTSFLKIKTKYISQVMLQAKKLSVCGELNIKAFLTCNNKVNHL